MVDRVALTRAVGMGSREQVEALAKATHQVSYRTIKSPIKPLDLIQNHQVSFKTMLHL